jgi:peptidoglycan/LPS O-acetylase OafA/YrhL
VITGLLMREHQGTGHTSILHFYARRCRRILPAATLVILVVVFFTYLLLGVVTGNNTADDGRWAAVFLANFHFEALGTNYLAATRPPSPLQNYWTLSVEEQFYVVFPTLFLLVARAKRLFSLRARLSVALGVVIIASYWLSIAQTASHPQAAYFSPFTRAWELALGGLVAVCTPWLKRIPSDFAALVTWAGLAAILYSSFAFNALTGYPGSVVAIPVVGTAMVIAGGVAIPRYGAESLLGLRPMRWLGKLSYSLYLWHWPVLIIAAQRVGKTSLSVGQNLLLVLVALVISIATYHLVENPIRHWRLPARRTVLWGAGLVLTTVLALSLVLVTQSVSDPSYDVVPAPNNQTVLNQVNAASKITTVPKGIEPSLAAAGNDWSTVGGNLHYPCTLTAGLPVSKIQVCTGGDPQGRHLMIVYGDSHIIMWYPAFEAMAKAAHWRLVMFSQYYCPGALLTVTNPPDVAPVNGPYAPCDSFHRMAVSEINALHPNMVVISQEDLYTRPTGDRKAPTLFSAAEWQQGLTRLLNAIVVPNVKKIVLGNIPILHQSGPACLAAHLDDVQACSVRLDDLPGGSSPPFAQAERRAAAATGTQYVDPTPWLCATVCTAIISHYCVYLDQFHITGTYAKYLEVVLRKALGFP